MSSYKEGQIHQLANAFEAAGATADDITKLGQYDKLDDLLGVLRGTHEIEARERILPAIASFNPAKFIGEGWKIIESETDHRASALREINFAKVGIGTCLKKGESRITGEEKLKRLKKSGKIRLGAETFLALWLEEGHKTLEWLHKEKGIIFLDFFGAVLESPGGNRFVLYLYRDGDGRWDWDYIWLDRVWNGDPFSASLAS